MIFVCMYSETFNKFTYMNVKTKKTYSGYSCYFQLFKQIKRLKILLRPESPGQCSCILSPTINNILLLLVGSQSGINLVNRLCTQYIPSHQFPYFIQQHLNHIHYTQVSWSYDGGRGSDGQTVIVLLKWRERSSCDALCTYKD